MSGARAESQKTIVRQAPKRLSSFPPGSPSAASPSSSAATTRLIRVAEPDVTRTNHGSASHVICPPVVEITSAASSGLRPRVRNRLTSERPHAVLLHHLAVELDPAARAQVLDDVPVDRRLVLAAEIGHPVSERDVDRAVHLLVEERVLHVAGDP